MCFVFTIIGAVWVSAIALGLFVLGVLRVVSAVAGLLHGGPGPVDPGVSALGCGKGADSVEVSGFGLVVVVILSIVYFIAACHAFDCILEWYRNRSRAVDEEIAYEDEQLWSGAAVDYGACYDDDKRVD